MNRLLSAKPVLAAAIAFGGLALASAAQARTDVHVSLGVPAPFVYAAPMSVYAAPTPVYVQPTPVYLQPRPAYVQPEVVYYGHEREWRRHHEHRNGAWGDADRDGVPNRFDRAPFNPHRR